MGIVSAARAIAEIAGVIKGKYEKSHVASDRDMLEKFAEFAIEKGLSEYNLPLVPSDEEKCNVYSSKLGGIPYMPKGFDYPCQKDGTPMRLLCQLNFSKLPHIKPFPENGILQMYLCDGGKIDLFDYQAFGTDTEDFRIIYFEDILNRESELMSADEMPQFESTVFPAVRERKLVPKAPVPAIISCLDYRFEETAVEFAKKYKLCPKDAHSLNDIPDNVGEKLYKVFSYSDFTGIGGSGSFLEEDLRGGVHPEYRDCTCCLFQLCDIEETCPDDEEIYNNPDGNIHFFIPPENLIKKDFSRVLFQFEI